MEQFWTSFDMVNIVSLLLNRFAWQLLEEEEEEEEEEKEKEKEKKDGL